jgi:hypothetical protein
LPESPHPLLVSACGAYVVSHRVVLMA